MRTAQYVRAERAISAGVVADIRARWLYGLRLLDDTEKIAASGGLKHGVAARLVARFPAYERPTGEPDADYRTSAEKRHAAAQALAETVGAQGSLFPLAQFEPTETPLKDLVDYADVQTGITVRFAEQDRKRRVYLDALIVAAGEDLSSTWQDAHRLAFGGEPA